MAREMLEQWRQIYDARLAETAPDADRQYSVVSDPDSGEICQPLSPPGGAARWRGT